MPRNQQRQKPRRRILQTTTRLCITHDGLLNNLNHSHVSFSGMVEFRAMKHSDLEFFMELMDMVGWGMTPQDFERILRFSPQDAFIATKNMEDVGIVVTLNYGTVAWLGNLVVRPQNRGQDIGTELMKHAINHLETNGIKSIRLDATPQAIPLYHRLGFKDEYPSLRYTGTAQKHSTTKTQPMKKQDLYQVTKLDQEYFKLDRTPILQNIHTKHPELCFTAKENKKLVGYIMAKDGTDSIKIGPWIVKPRHEQEAEELLHSVMNKRINSKIWVGIPQGNKSSVKILEKNGFTPNQSSLRMCYGDCDNQEDISGVYGLGGPDKG